MRVRKGITAAVVLALATGMLTGQSASAVNPINDATIAYSDEFSNEDIELLDGLVFGVGPFAEKIGNTIEEVLPTAELNLYVEQAAEFRDGLLEDRGAEVTEALEGVRSGNVNEVEESLSHLADITLGYAEGRIDKEVSSSELKAYAADASKISPTACTPATFCALAVALYAALVVHNTVGVTALAAVVVGGWLWCGVTTGCSTASTATGSKMRASLSGTSAGEQRAYERFIAGTTKAAAAW